MAFIRRLAASSALAASLSCGARQNAAPMPDSVVPSADPKKDWFSAALNIQEPSQFSAWEPVLEEMAGTQAVPHSKVSIVPSKEVKAACGDDAGGCYLPGNRGILIDESWSPGELARRRYPDGEAAETCEGRGSLDLKSYPRLAVWAHEQGHSFDLSLGEGNAGRWIDQLEAVAFEYYFAEHVAKNYDRHLGLNLLVLGLLRSGMPSWGTVGGEGFAQWHVDAFRKKLSDVDSGGIKPGETELSHQSLYVLLGAGFQSFGDAWHFIHTNKNEDVAALVRKNARLVVEGRVDAENIILALAGVKNPANTDVPGILDGEHPGRLSSASMKDQLLVVEFRSHVAKFGRLGADIFVRLERRDEDFSLTAAFSPYRKPENRSMAADDSTGRILTLSSSDESSSVRIHSNAVMGGPSFCRSVGRDEGDAAPYIAGARSAMLRAVAALEAAGKAEEAAFALGVLDEVLPAGAK